MEILRVENICKTYEMDNAPVHALSDVSFSVDKGEFVAIIGASGSGKSTLLHILGGVDRPTSGKVFVDGQDVYEQNEDELAVFRRRQVGLVYQFYNLIPVLTVEENITLPIRLDGRKINQERLINAPAIILADEPTGNLDTENTRDIMKLLRESNEVYRQTMILITHDREIAMQADRILEIQDGRLVRDEVIR